MDIIVTYIIPDTTGFQVQRIAVLCFFPMYKSMLLFIPGTKVSSQRIQTIWTSTLFYWYNKTCLGSPMMELLHGQFKIWINKYSAGHTWKFMAESKWHLSFFPKKTARFLPSTTYKTAYNTNPQILWGLTNETCWLLRLLLAISTNLYNNHIRSQWLKHDWLWSYDEKIDTPWN